MDYEKAYKAAKRLAAHWIENGCEATEKILLETIFPELKASEDEKMRKKAIEYIDAFVPYDDKEEIIAYLERQKEQKPIKTLEEREYVKTLKGLVSDFVRDRGDSITDVDYYQRIYDWLDGRYIEQKPAEWSEEDEEHLKSIISTIEMCMMGCENASAVLGYYDSDISWLKSLRPQPHWKPSEEQMKILNCAANGMVDKSMAAPEMRAALRELYVQLKKLM